MENNLFQQAKHAVTNMMKMQGNSSQEDQQAAQDAIQAAYTEASPEERQQLEQLEQQLKSHNRLQ